ncbi:MAG: hypothetical protein MMC33_010847 [Icmadophila ericetorum]|nr:hypothetical protein [Icmadophila ericetorum]
MERSFKLIIDIWRMARRKEIAVPTVIAEPPHARCGFLLVFRQRRRARGELTKLLYLLHDTRHLAASKLKNKVYAMVGCASDAVGFTVDYTKSLREVFIEVVRHTIVSSSYGRQLDFLGYCVAEEKAPSIAFETAKLISKISSTRIHLAGIASEMPRASELAKVEEQILSSLPLELASLVEWENCRLPNWVPNWHQPQTRAAFRKLLKSDCPVCENVYSASGRTFESVRAYMDKEQYISIIGDELAAVGFKLEDIVELSALWDLERRDGGRLGSTIQKTWEPYHIGSTYFTSESVHQAFLHTLVADIKIGSTGTTPASDHCPSE